MAAVLPSVAEAQTPPTVPSKHTEKSSAQDSVQEASGEKPFSLEGWYGYQILIGDAAAIGMLALGMEKDSMTWIYPAAATYLFPSPTIHAVHRNPGRSSLSAGMRLVAAVAGIKLMYSNSSGCGKDYEYQHAECTATPAYVTLIVAGLLDAGLLAWETPPRPSVLQAPKTSTKEVLSVELSPTVATLPGGAYLGLLGSF